METIVEKIEAEYGIVAKIIPDNDPMNPREDACNFGTMVCFHKRYSLPNESDLSYNQFNSWDELEAYIENEKHAAIILPIYMYDHSGCTIRTTPFGDRWDSGQIGFIYVTREEILQNWNAKKLTKKLLKHAKELMIGEVATYDQFLRGDVYGYDVQDADGESLDSCWGFFGIEHVREEAKNMIERHIKKRKAVIDAENNHGAGI